MKVVRSFKTALSRQVGEAVRIRRRGGEGNILNSKAEYSRSRIPRLMVDQQANKEILQMEEEELWRKREQLEEELREWSQIKYYAREQELREKKKQLYRIEGRIKAYKREQEGAQAPKEGKRRKLVHSKVGENWGESSHGGGAKEGDTLPTPREQGEDTTPTPSKGRMRQRKLSEMLQPERRLPQLAATYTPPGEDEEDREFGKQKEEREGEEQQPGEEEEPPSRKEEAIQTGQTSSLSSIAQLNINNAETSSEQVCTFKKGTCTLHGIPGTKYIVTKTKWKDRGSGKGFGNVYSKTVKYRCSGKGKTDPDFVQSNSEKGRLSTLPGSAFVYSDDHLLKLKSGERD